VQAGNDVKSLYDTLYELWAGGEPVAIATVADTKKSAPAPVGTKMIVGRGGQVVGAVSAGCVEGAVVEAAERVLAGGPPQLLHYGIADEDAWDIGLTCGGEISVWVQASSGDGVDTTFLQQARGGGRASLVTVVGGSAKLGARLLVLEHGDPAGTLGGPALDAEAVPLAAAAMWSGRGGLHRVGAVTLFIDVVGPPPKLIMVGAVDFAAQLSAVAALAGWRPFVVDPRTRFATDERFPAAERVIAAWPAEAFAQIEPIDPATAIAVLTNDPKLDDAALLAALESDAGYIGAMGSRVAQRKRHERLVAAGVSEDRLERIAAPIGLDLGAMTAAETALSIMSEIVALRHGRTGGRLIEARGRIHDAAAA
jgi:xanthine dehydrogenase accessory factor